MQMLKIDAKNRQRTGGDTLPQLLSGGENPKNPF